MIDSHCHLTDARFDGDRGKVIRRAVEAGVGRIVTIASNADDAEAVIDLVAAHPEHLRGTAGIHPHEADSATERNLERIAELCRSEGIVAVGETGLDFHYDNSPRDLQRVSFRFHLELAAERDLPVVVHTRDAEEDTMRFLAELGPSVRGVLHCFTGSRELMEAGLEAGWWISLSGIVTFNSWTDEELLRAIPDDRLLLETDAPYLAPVPHRGKRNEPAFIRHTAEYLAGVRGVGVEELAAKTSRNAEAFYRWEGLPSAG